MSVGADTADEQVDAACLLDHLLVVRALGDEVLGVAVEDVDVLLGDVNVVEEVGGHEAMIALGMAFGQGDVLVHVERQHVLEGHASGLVGFDEGTVHTDGAAARGQAQHERLLGRRCGSVDLVDNILSCPLGHLIIVRFDDDSHNLLCLMSDTC